MVQTVGGLIADGRSTLTDPVCTTFIPGGRWITVWHGDMNRLGPVTKEQHPGCHRCAQAEDAHMFTRVEPWSSAGPFLQGPPRAVGLIFRGQL